MRCGQCIKYIGMMQPVLQCVCFSLFIGVAVSTPPGNNHTLGIAVLACNRPRYLMQCAKALSLQTGGGKHVTIYIDSCGRTKEMQFIGTRYLPHADIVHADTNVGIAVMTVRAQIAGFKQYDRMLFIEEDHVVGPNYIANIQVMLDVAETLPTVGVVNGAYKAIETKPDCNLVARSYCAETNRQTHNVWAWATTLNKWQTFFPTYHKWYVESGLNACNYKKRNGAQILSIIKRSNCPKEMLRWPGQDWLRLCAMHYTNMPLKLTTSRRMLTYIGEIGMHSSKGSLQIKGFSQQTPRPWKLSHPNVTICYDFE